MNAWPDLFFDPVHKIKCYNTTFAILNIRLEFKKKRVLLSKQTITNNICTFTKASNKIFNSSRTTESLIKLTKKI